MSRVRYFGNSVLEEKKKEKEEAEEEAEKVNVLGMDVNGPIIA